MTTAASRPRAYTESELFSWPSAQLSLLHETEHALLQRGTFTLLLAHHSRSAHLLVVEASVGDVRWPVGKDCFVTAPSVSAVDARSAASCCFLFQLCLPSSHDQLTYQLLLFDHDHDPSAASSHCLQQISKLQSLLALYANLHLQQLAPTNPGRVINPLKELEESAGEYWVSKVNDNNQIEPGQQDGTGAFEKQVEMKEAMDCQSSHGSSSTATSPTGVSKRMMKRMQKARRISAVSKLFSKAVVRGLINAKAHVVHKAGAAAASKHISNALVDVNENGIKPAVANVEAITKVVEAVEGGLPEDILKPLTRHAAAYDQRCETVLDISALATWTINESGLRLVLNAAMAANKSMQDIVSAGATIAHLHSVSSSCLTSCTDNNSGVSTAMLAASTEKAVEEKLCRAGSKFSSSSHLSSLLQTAGSTDRASSGSPSASRPPRPRPRRVGFLLNEVSSPLSVNSGNSHIQK